MADTFIDMATDYPVPVLSGTHSTFITVGPKGLLRGKMTSKVHLLGKSCFQMLYEVLPGWEDMFPHYYLGCVVDGSAQLCQGDVELIVPVKGRIFRFDSFDKQLSMLVPFWLFQRYSSKIHISNLCQNRMSFWGICVNWQNWIKSSSTQN